MAQVETDAKYYPSLGAMFRFFMPLATTSFLILLSLTLMNAATARLSRPEFYLAAFALAKSLFEVLQSPSMIIRQCMSGLTRDSQSFLAGKRVFFIMVLLVTAVFLIFAYSGAGLFVFRRLMGGSDGLSLAALRIFRVLVWLQFAWFMRDAYGPAAIRLRETQILPAATLLRVMLAAVSVWIASRVSFANDVLVPGLIFLACGYTEALAVWAMVKFKIKDYLVKLDHLPGASPARGRLTARQIAVYSLPVLAMSLTRALGDPAVNAGLAYSSSPEMALAAYSVGWSVALLVLETSGMYHQVILNFMDPEKRMRPRLLKLTAILSLAQTAILALLAFTPLGEFALRRLLGSGESLAPMALGVLAATVPMPITVNLREYYWGVSMLERRTRWMSIGKSVQLATLVAGVVSLVLLGNRLQNPALIAPLALGFSMTAEAAMLAWLNFRQTGRF